MDEEVGSSNGGGEVNWQVQEGEAEEQGDIIETREISGVKFTVKFDQDKKWITAKVLIDGKKLCSLFGDFEWILSMHSSMMGMIRQKNKVARTLEREYVAILAELRERAS